MYSQGVHHLAIICRLHARDDGHCSRSYCRDGLVVMLGAAVRYTCNGTAMTGIQDRIGTTPYTQPWCVGIVKPFLDVCMSSLREGCA